MLRIGRIEVNDPISWSEPIGEALSKIGASPVPGGRSGLTFSFDVETYPGTGGGTTAEREKLRRQIRSMVNNLPYRLQAIPIFWSEDPEQDGWFSIGAASMDLVGTYLGNGLYKVSFSDVHLVGRPRTHRRGVSIYVNDLRLSTTPRDTLKRVYSTDFSTLPSLPIAWMPSHVTDVCGCTGTAVTSAQAGYGTSSIQGRIGVTDLSVLHFEQGTAYVNRGDVVIYDTKGSASVTTGPATAWEEIYGPDWPLTANTVPVLDNGFTRVRYDSTNVPGFIIDVWKGGTAWEEQGKVCIRRYAAGVGTSYLDTFQSAQVYEWTPERGVVKVVMNVAADSKSREEIFLSLERGWKGPRIESYFAKLASGTAASGSLEYFSAFSTATIHTAMKYDSTTSAIYSSAGSSVFPSAALGAGTFSGDNFMTMMRAGGSVGMHMASVQQGSGGRTYSGTAAYGSTRNALTFVGSTTAGYLSAHFGSYTQKADQMMEAEAMTISTGSSAASDANASNGTAVTATRTSSADHVTKATWLSDNAVYDIFARCKTTAGTLSIRAICGGVTGSTKTTTSTSYTWVYLGSFTATGTTLQIQAWTSSGTLSVDRIEAFKLQDRGASGTGNYDGAQDHGYSILHDTHIHAGVVSRI